MEHRYISFSEYEQWPQPNVSLFVHAFKSWRQFQHVKAYGYRPAINTRVGQALHAIAECLPLERFDELFVSMPDFRRDPGNVTSDGKASSHRTAWVRDQEAAFSAAHQGRDVLPMAELNRCRRMIRAIQSNEAAEQLIVQSMREVSLTATLFGVECKGRIDGIHIGSRCLWDLKTTKDIAPRAFGRTVANLRYVFRLAFYWLLLHKNDFDCDEVKLIAVQDSTPNSDGFYNEAPECAVYDVPMIAIENQLSEVGRLLDEYQQCVQRDKWPGVQNQPLWIPNWSMGEIELV